MLELWQVVSLGCMVIGVFLLAISLSFRIRGKPIKFPLYLYGAAFMVWGSLLWEKFCVIGL